MDQVVARHDVLRAVYRLREEATSELVDQVIQPARGRVLRLTDLSGIPAAAARDQISRALRGDAVFDLATGPVFGAQLFRLGELSHVLICDAHHIAFDGWSVAVLYSELAQLYRAELTGSRADLPELAIQYQDFAAWQRERITPEVTGEQLAYWRQQLHGAAAPVLPGEILPGRRAGRAGSRASSDRGGLVHVNLPAGQLTRLADFAAAQGTTLFAILAAGLDVLLGRYTASDDILLGTAILTRDRPEVASLIGCFINTVMLRLPLTAGATFRSIVAASAEAVRAAIAHGDVPFEQVISELQPDRDPGQTPLISVHLTLDESGAALPDLPGLRAEACVPELDTAKFALGFNVRTLPSGDATAGVLYQADRFTADTVRRMLSHYVRLLTDAVSHPDTPWTDLDMLSPAEQREIMIDWNDTAAPYPDSACLDELFDDRAAEHPEAPAVVSGRQSLSYHELELRANRIAHVLVRRGVRPGDLVAIFLPRCLDLPAAILGVLKSGAAYVPIDPDYPAARLQHILADSQPASIITSGELAARIQPASR